jgi:uncharacterized protein YneF (UPF0154 family)
MEWTELQAMWQQYDARLAENTRINKEILKRIIRSKPEKRLKWMKGWAIYGMVIPVPLMCIIFIPNVKFRNEWDFYLGFVLLIALLASMLYQGIRWFLLIRDIDFTNQVAKTKKQLIQLKEYRIKNSKWGFLFFFAGVAGIFLMIGEVLVMTKEFIKVPIFILFLTIGSVYTKRKRFKNQLKNFNAELDEIEQLEKE